VILTPRLAFSSSFTADEAETEAQLTPLFSLALYMSIRRTKVDSEESPDGATGDAQRGLDDQDWTNVSSSDFWLPQVTTDGQVRCPFASHC
jgi:hypothetical protein